MAILVTLFSRTTAPYYYINSLDNNSTTTITMYALKRTILHITSSHYYLYLVVKHGEFLSRSKDNVERNSIQCFPHSSGSLFFVSLLFQ